MNENNATSMALKGVQPDELLGSTRVLIHRVSPDGHLLFVNDVWLEALGYAAEDTRALNIFAFLHPQYHEHWLTWMQRVMAGEDVGRVAMALLARDGWIVAVEGYLNPYRTEGRVTAVHGQFRLASTLSKVKSNLATGKRDTLAIVQRTDSQQTGVRRFEELIASMSGALFEVRVDAQDQYSLVYVSEGIASLIGLSATACLTDANNMLGGVSSAALSDLKASIRHSGQNLLPWSHVCQVQTPAGKKWLQAHATPKRHQDGSTHWLGVVLDITVQKESEAVLQKQEQLVYSLTESVPVGIFRTDVLGRCLYANDRWCNIAGLSRDEALGYGWTTAVHVEDRERVMNEWQQAVQNQQQFMLEYRFKTRQQITTWILGLAQVERNLQGEVQGYIGTITDITLQKGKEVELAASRKLLQSIIDTAPVRIFWKDRESRFLGCNSAFARDAGARSIQDMIGTDDYQWSWKSQAALYQQDDQKVIQSGKPHLTYEEPQTTPSGKTIWLRTSKVPLRNGDNEIIGVLGIYQDVTKQKQIIDSMRLAATIYQSSNEAIMVTDENDRIIQVNPAFTRITGFEMIDVLGKSPEIFRSGRHDTGFYQEMRQKLMNEDHWQGEIWDLRKDGCIQAKWLSISIIRHPDGRIHYHVTQFTDITEKKKQDELILSQANYDQLTGLPNRNLFKDRLEMEIKKSRRNGARLAVLFLDLDHFKDINDTLGHDKGDDLLSEVAARIKSCVDKSDTVARLGGDEFAIILSDWSGDQRVESIALQIIKRLNRPFRFNQSLSDYHISTSIGIVFYPQDGANMKSLMKHADQAMYAAKLEGRNRFCYFTPSMQRQASEKMALIHDLRQAIGKNELQVYFQPILELASGRLLKAEALLRWKHSRRGMISPGTFIPLAEESGLIVEIGEMVFKQAVAMIDRCLQRSGHSLQISINMSPIQFKSLNCLQWFDQLLEIGLPGNCINVEITEGLLLRDSPVVQQSLLEFRNNGVEVSIDDFGTGFSSLSYLKKFDIDYLKIDHSFINQLLDSETDRALVEAIIVMAHKLDIKTIAEGVETQAQQDLLQHFGCDYVQGFLYSKPVKAQAFEKLFGKTGTQTTR